MVRQKRTYSDNTFKILSFNHFCCAFPLLTHFKDFIFETIFHIFDNFPCIGHIFYTLHTFYNILREFWQFYGDHHQIKKPAKLQALTQAPPPSDESITEVKKQIYFQRQTTPPTDEFITEVREQIIES